MKPPRVLHRILGTITAGLSVWLCAHAVGQATLPEPTEPTPSTPAPIESVVNESPPEGAQEQTQTANGLPAVEQLQRRLTEIEADTLLDDKLKAQLTRHYEQSIEFIEQAESFASQRAEFEQLAESAPSLLAKMQDELSAPPAPPVTLPEDVTLADAQAALQSAQAAADQAESERAAFDTVIRAPESRRAACARELVIARQRLEELDASPDTSQPDDPPAMAEAKQVLWAAERLAAERQIDALSAELATYDARTSLKLVEFDLVMRRVSQTTAAAGQLKQAASQLQAEQLQREGERARQQIQEAGMRHPMLGAVAKANEELIAEHVTLSVGREELETDRGHYTELQATVAQRLAEVRARAEATGELSESLGLLLRKIQDELPSESSITAGWHDRRQAIIRTQDRILDLKLVRVELSNLDAAADELMSHLTPPVSPEVADDYRAEFHELLTTQRDLVEALLKEYDQQFSLLIEADTARDKLLEMLDQIDDFIDERVL